jgi:Fe-S-cluster containining protein
MGCHSLPSKDPVLVQIVNAALGESAQRSGHWLACRPGCSQCCVGVFAINQLDAARLRKGLAILETHDPERAARIRTRAEDAVARLSPEFPGDPMSGVLDESPEAAQRWNDFAPDEPCPVLDPQTGTCELYESRPILCRTFGPPIMSEGDLGVCELCYEGATDEQIAACEMHPDPENLEAALLKEYETETGLRGETIIAFALVR